MQLADDKPMTKFETTINFRKLCKKNHSNVHWTKCAQIQTRNNSVFGHSSRSDPGAIFELYNSKRPSELKFNGWASTQ